MCPAELMEYVALEYEIRLKCVGGLCTCVCVCVCVRACICACVHLCVHLCELLQLPT